MKTYDLEDRTARFANNCRKFAYATARTALNVDDLKQLIKSSGSVAANYIESHECLSKKDSLHRIKICRKEARESRLWLELLSNQPRIPSECFKLIQEALELTKIFGAIVTKLEQKP